MKNIRSKSFLKGIVFIVAFVIWTILIQVVDVQPVGQNGTDIGLATINTWFHSLTETNMVLYNVTDWLGLVPIFVCFVFAGLGMSQVIKRKSLFLVDCDIAFLGVYYVVVIFGYLIFEMIPINYRPILINGFLEASYPSSTTLLVLSVMPTLTFQTNRRLRNNIVRNMINIFSIAFSLFMVIGRVISGVHWITDIIGSLLLSMGLFSIYKAVALTDDAKGK